MGVGAIFYGRRIFFVEGFLNFLCVKVLWWFLCGREFFSYGFDILMGVYGGFYVGRIFFFLWGFWIFYESDTYVASG